MCLETLRKHVMFLKSVDTCPCLYLIPIAQGYWLSLLGAPIEV